MQMQQHNTYIGQLQSQIKDLRIFIKQANDQPSSIIDGVQQTMYKNEVPEVANQVTAEDLESKLTSLKRELELKAADISQSQIRKMLQERIESDTLLEGRAAIFSVEVEKKVLA